ncbi:MAG: helix-turn-helix transcriptional regulator [Gammaproteobacteria bacterium]|nr:helix-turn-helix transcriptional regulator [Gammaproteobacteria bacterium]
MAERNLFERIVAALQEAALDDALWPAASGLIDMACGSKGNFLATGDGTSADDLRIFFARVCFRGQRREQVEQDFLQTYHPIDESMPRIRHLPDAKVTHVHELYTEEEKKISVAYNEGRPATTSANSLNVRLDGPHGSRIVWALADPVDDRGWSSERVSNFKRTLPHLRQYGRIRQTLADVHALGSTSVMLLENTRCAILQLDPGGRIVATNEIARTLLREGDGLQDKNGLLCATHREDNEALQKLLTRALPRFGVQGESGSWNLRRANHPSRLLLHVHPVSGEQWDARHSRIASFVLVIDPTRQARIDPAQVALVFGLSETQGHVAAMLAQGHTIRDIAALMNLSEFTIRWHTKEIYRKLGIPGQAALVRMVLALPDVSSSQQ